MLPSDNISIRKCDVNDIEALTSFHLRSFSAEDHIPVMLGKNYVKAYYKWLLTSPDTYALCAEFDHKIVGLVGVCDYSYTKATKGIAQMTIVAVDSKFRGNSIFPQLVEATKHYSKERGSRAIVAGLYGINKSSRAVFVKDNWREVPELQTSELIFFIAFLDPTIQEALFL